VAARESFARRVSVAGRVTDALTGGSIAGATVLIVTAPKEFTAWLAIRSTELASRGVGRLGMPDAAVTGPDGWFHFDGLPDGKYAVEASLPSAGTRYGTARKKVTVKRVPDAPSTAADASLALAPTAITGVVRDAAGAAVPMAEIRIRGSGEKALSDAQGRYTLSAIERGTRIVLASARGLAPASVTVTLADAGVQEKLDIALSPAG